MTKNKNDSFQQVAGAVMDMAYTIAAKELGLTTNCLHETIAQRPLAQALTLANALCVAINQVDSKLTPQDALTIAALPPKDAEQHVRFFAHPLARVLTRHLAP